MIEYLLAVFGVYFVARTIALEDGPFGLCAELRDWIDPEQRQDTWLKRGINCPICLGFWIAALISPLLISYVEISLAEAIRQHILNALGLAGMVTALYLWVEK